MKKLHRRPAIILTGTLTAVLAFICALLMLMEILFTIDLSTLINVCGAPAMAVGIIFLSLIVIDAIKDLRDNETY